MHRAHILGHDPWAKNAVDLVEVYRPFITDLHTDYVSIQVASVDPLATMELVRTEVLLHLRRV